MSCTLLSQHIHAWDCMNYCMNWIVQEWVLYPCFMISGVNGPLRIREKSLWFRNFPVWSVLSLKSFIAMNFVCKNYWYFKKKGPLEMDQPSRGIWDVGCQVSKNVIIFSTWEHLWSSSVQSFPLQLQSLWRWHLQRTFHREASQFS